VRSFHFQPKLAMPAQHPPQRPYPTPTDSHLPAAATQLPATATHLCPASHLPATVAHLCTAAQLPTVATHLPAAASHLRTAAHRPATTAHLHATATAHLPAATARCWLCRTPPPASLASAPPCKIAPTHPHQSFSFLVNICSHNFSSIKVHPVWWKLSRPCSLHSSGHNIF
jgi:hypothetical protein